MRTLALLGGFALLLSACAGSGASGSAPSGSPLDMKLIARGQHSGANCAPLCVARTQEEWAALWSALGRAQLPPPPAPPLDFATRMAVCVCLGERPSASWGVELLGAWSEPARIRIEARELRPAEGAVQAAVLTRPYQVVSLPRSDAPLELIWR